jgi:hypothetical protein
MSRIFIAYRRATKGAACMEDSDTLDWIRATTFVAIGDGLLWNALSFAPTSPSR